MSQKAESESPNVGRVLPTRIIIATLGVLACILLSSTRYNLSIAIVSMVQGSCTANSSICSSVDVEHSVNFYEVVNCNPINLNDERLSWSEAEQGLALGAYYYGFAATHIFGGRLAEKHGPKWVTAVGLCGAAIFNVLLPIATTVNFTTFVIIRVLVGAFHGVVLPSLFFMFRTWFPKKEQPTALALLLIGTILGLIVNVPIAGAISKLSIPNEWSLLFYGGSSLHLIWLVLWIFLASDKPEENRYIKDAEIFYIRQNSNNILETVPWRQILKTKALYASIAAKICYSFNHAVIIDNGPSYLNRVVGFNMYQASLCIALVYLATSIIYLLAIPLYKYTKHWIALSKTRMRKIFQSFVFIGAFTTMFILPSVGCDETIMIILLVINMASQGFISVGEYPLITDYAGFYSGTVYGIAITFDSLARFVAPIIRGELVKKSDTLTNWNIIFYITAVVNVVGFCVFEFCASANLKKWAVKREMIKQISSNGHIEPTVKKELKKQLQNPFFRLSINTNTDDWEQFKSEAIVP